MKTSKIVRILINRTCNKWINWIQEKHFQFTIRLLQKRVTKMYLKGMKGDCEASYWNANTRLLPVDRYGEVAKYTISEEVCQQLAQISKAADTLIDLARQHGKEDAISGVFEQHSKITNYANYTQTSARSAS